MKNASARYRTGLDYLATIEGQQPPSLEANLRDIAPDLARLAVEFAYGEVYPRRQLDLRQRQLVTSGVLAALGNARPQLKFHLAGALNVGCTAEELVELAIHMIVYVGFPAAINTAMILKELFEERGITLTRDDNIAPRNAHQTRFELGWERLKEIDGHAGERVIAALQDISSDLGRYIIEFAFGDVYSRTSMDLELRELVTVAALIALGTASAQLKIHMHGFLNVGGTKDQLIEIVTHTAIYAGFPAAINGALVAKEVVSERAKHVAPS